MDIAVTLTPPPKVLDLELSIREPEVVAELLKHDEGTNREQFALSALRIGVLALRHATGLLDANAVRAEGERLVADIRELLTSKTTDFLGTVASTLKSYFDPAEGHLPQRLNRLISKDGELQAVLSQHLDGDECVIARTLSKHIGKDSPLLRLLSPEDQEGVIAGLSKCVDAALRAQREHILRQFSLDDKESAFSRLVVELTGANGKLREDLAGDVKKLHGEFSLDNEQGALSRLVGKVEKAQRSISEQFSLDNKESALSRLVGLMQTANNAIKDNLTLDNENSPLSLLRRELTDIIKRLEDSSREFHEEVRTTLESFKARREEAARSTRHGMEFEEALGSVLVSETQKAGDIHEAVGSQTGLIPYCRVGDHLVTLGAENVAAGAKIVVEAKEDRSYSLSKALDEIKEARENRGAQVGLFVFSKNTAPTELEPFSRYGSDVFVVWDRDDPESDFVLRVGLSVAKALAVRERLSTEKAEADLVGLREAINGLTRETDSLVAIMTFAGTAKRAGEKIEKKAKAIKKRLERNLKKLNEYLAAVGDNGEGETGLYKPDQESD
jgi:hypothetical protein